LQLFVGKVHLSGPPAFLAHNSAGTSCVIPRLHDQAIIKQTSSKHEANVEQLEYT